MDTLAVNELSSLVFRVRVDVEGLLPVKLHQDQFEEGVEGTSSDSLSRAHSAHHP